jgi:hypothetical protein
MIVLGLLVLLAAGGLAVSGITTRGDSAHFPARSGLPGYHLPGPGSRLFSSDSSSPRRPYPG